MMRHYKKYIFQRQRVSQARGFTLIEILVVIGMIGILAAAVLVAVNPLKQFAQARNTQRISNVNALLNAVGNRIADNRGLFPGGSNCSADIPTTPTEMQKSGGFDIRPCLVPGYISELPYDPVLGSNSCDDDTACMDRDYLTGYSVVMQPTSHRITVCAPHMDSEPPYCLSR